MRAYKQQISKVAKKHQLDFVILHGSKAKKGVRGPEADNGGIKAEEYFQIYKEMVSIFKGEELDLKTLHRVNPLFRFYVARDSQLLYGDKTEFNEFKAYAYRSLVDSLSLIELEDFLTEKYQKELRGWIAKSAGFRNAIVHGYNKLDEYLVYRSVKEAVKEYSQYCEYILKRIRNV